MIRAAMAALAFLALAGLPAARAQAAPDNENGRYSFRTMGDELLRLDGRTGEVSTCRKRPAGWACLLVPDERTALETEITRLQGENATLKRELIARGIALPSGMKTPPHEPQANEIIIKLPSDADLDRVRDFLEKAWRRLRGMVQGLQRDFLQRDLKKG